MKEVAPHTATAVTSSFWKKDLKATRAMLHRNNEENTETAVEESLIEEWSVSIGFSVQLYMDYQKQYRIERRKVKSIH